MKRRTCQGLSFQDSQGSNLSARSNQHHDVLAVGNMELEETLRIIRLCPFISHTTILYNLLLKTAELHLKSNFGFLLLPGRHSCRWKRFYFLLKSNLWLCLFCERCPAAFLLADIYTPILQENPNHFSSQHLLSCVKQAKFSLLSPVRRYLHSPLLLDVSPGLGPGWIYRKQRIWLLQCCNYLSFVITLYCPSGRCFSTTNVIFLCRSSFCYIDTAVYMVRSLNLPRVLFPFLSLLSESAVEDCVSSWHVQIF